MNETMAPAAITATEAIDYLGQYEKKREEFENEKKKLDRRKTNYRIASAVLAAVCVFLIVLRWFIGGWWIDWDTSQSLREIANDSTGNAQAQAVYADFAAPPHEENAVVGIPSVDETLGWSSLEVQTGYIVHVCGVLKADENGVLPVYFSSDADNVVWVKLRVIDEAGNRLGETGLLYSGEYVEALQLNENAASGTVTLQIMGYEPESYYSAGTVGLMTELVMPGD